MCTAQRAGKMIKILSGDELEIMILFSES